MADSGGLMRRLLPLLLLLPLLASPVSAAVVADPYAHGHTEAPAHCVRKIHRAEESAGIWDGSKLECTRTFELVLSKEARDKFCAVVDSRYFGTVDPSTATADQFSCKFAQLHTCGDEYLEHRGRCIHVSKRPMSANEAATYCENVATLKQKSRRFTPLTHRDTEFLARAIHPNVGLVLLNPAESEKIKLLKNYDKDAKTAGYLVFNVAAQMTSNDSVHFKYREPGVIFHTPDATLAHTLCVRLGSLTHRGLQSACEAFYPTVGLPTVWRSDVKACVYTTVNNYAAEFRSMREMHSHCSFDLSMRQRALSPKMLGSGEAIWEEWMGSAYEQYVPIYKQHMQRVHSGASAQFSLYGKDFFGFGVRLPIYNGALENQPTFVDSDGTAYKIRVSTMKVNGVPFLYNVKSLQDYATSGTGVTKYDLNAVLYMLVDDSSGKREMRARLDAVVPHRRLPVMCQMKTGQKKNEPNLFYQDCPPSFIEYRTPGVGRTCLMMVTPDVMEIFWRLNDFRDHTPITTQIATELNEGNRHNINMMKKIYDAYEKFCNNYEDARYPGRKVGAALARFANSRDVADSLSVFAGSASVGSVLKNAAMVAGFSKSNRGGGTDQSKASFTYRQAFMGQTAPPKDSWALPHREPNNYLNAEFCVQLLPEGMLNDIFCTRPKKILCRIHEPLSEREIY